MQCILPKNVGVYGYGLLVYLCVCRLYYHDFQFVDDNVHIRGVFFSDILGFLRVMKACINN